MHAMIESAMRAMQAAAEGRAIYGAAHPAVLAQLERAAALFNQSLGEQDAVRVMVLPGRIMVDDQTLDGSTMLLDGLFGRLLDAGVNSLTIQRGVVADDISDAIESVRRGDELGARRARRLVFGRVAQRVEHCEEQPQLHSTEAVIPPDSRIPMLRAAWNTIEDGNQIVMDSLSTIAGELSVAAANAGELLPLAGLKSHDEYTFVHTINVGILASALGQAVGLTGARLKDLTAAALLHDVGKREVPAAILNKPGQLDDAELAVMRRHPVTGARILAGLERVPDLASTVAFEHHMNLDGSGYPIVAHRWRVSLGSQIVHVADVYDALRTHRPYRPAMSIEKALTILEDQAGVSFDRDLLCVFRDSVVSRTPSVVPRPAGLDFAQDDGPAAAAA
jgi:putative nucleotidyltransferase with HDIG domain